MLLPFPFHAVKSHPFLITFVSIIIPIFNYNYGINYRKDKPGWVLSHFQSTEQISTYSVTILVSEFVNSNDKTTLPPDNIPVGFWSRPDVKDQMNFASEIVVDALKFFADLFKFPFTFKKFDIAVIPDFQSINKEGFTMATFG